VLPNELRPVPGSTHKKKRVGRGNASGDGTTAGRGQKGQRSRSGRDLRIGFEGGQIQLTRALSRLRGFNNKFRVEYEPINVSALSRFDAGSSVNVEVLRSAGLIKTSKPVKVLGDGDLSVKLAVEAHKVSKSARAKIEAAGGSVVELNRSEPEEAEASAPARRKRQRPAVAQPEAAADSADDADPLPEDESEGEEA
jgi:large subunit ribosomal protein L15